MHDSKQGHQGGKKASKRMMHRNKMVEQEDKRVEEQNSREYI